MQNKTTPQRMHNDAWTQSADRASTAAPYITASYNSKQQPTRERDRADTTVSSNPSGIHRPANTRRRARYEQHGRAQPHQTLQHRTTQNINDKQRADTAVCRNSSTRRRVHAISIKRARANMLDTAVSRNPSGSHHTANTQRYTRCQQRGRAKSHQTPQHLTIKPPTRSRESGYRRMQQLINSSACTQLGEEQQAQPCQSTQLTSRRESIQPYSATRLKYTTACGRNQQIERAQTPQNRTTPNRKTREPVQPYPSTRLKYTTACARN